MADDPNNYEKEAQELKAFQSPERRNHMAWGRIDVQHKSDKHNPLSVDYYKNKLQSKLKEDVTRKLKGTFEAPHNEKVCPDTTLTPEQTQDHLAHRGSLNDEDIAAIRQYKLQSHSTNAPLRDDWLHGKGEESHKAYVNGQTKNMVDRMDKVTNRSLSHDHVSFRGFGDDFDIHKLKPGATFQDHGFTGTSLSKRMAGSFGKQVDGHTVIAKIHSPAGIAKGHYLDMNDESAMAREKEFLLARGGHFQVMKHTRHNDGMGGRFHIVHMKLLGHEPKEVHDSSSRYSKT